MDDTMQERLQQAARRLIASDKAYAKAQGELDSAVQVSNDAKAKILAAMEAAGIRLLTVGNVLFERDTHVVHWSRIDAVLPDDEGEED